MKKKIFNALLLLSLSLIILITGTVTISFNSYYESTTFEQLRNEAQLVIKGIEDEEEIATAMPESRFTPQDIRMIEDYHGLREEQQKRLMAYMEALKKIERCFEMDILGVRSQIVTLNGNCL